MSGWQDWILDVIADIIARFIVGFLGVCLALSVIAYVEPAILVSHWALALFVASGVGAAYAILGLRKGPGAI